MLFKLGLLLIIASISRVQGACYNCDPTTHVACYNETTFQVCFEEGEESPSIENINECPEGTVCVQTNKKICVERDTPGVMPSCISECGKCSDDQLFACMSGDEFSFCYGTDNPVGPNIRCPQGRVCRRGAPTYCVASDDTQPPSCADGEIGTTTTAPPTEPSTSSTENGSSTEPTPTTPTRPPSTNEFCVNQARPGRYPLPNDTTCRRYIYCYFLSGRLVGQEFECPLQTHFSPPAQVCVTLNLSTCRPSL